jgi:hypothetical protein
MSWPRAFLAVPSAALVVDADVARTSPKAGRGEIEQWMRDVPKIYARLQAGATDADFHRMSTSPASPEERQLAETYRNLFSTSASAQPLRAELDGGQLRVVAGQHRVRAAQETGVPLLPVHVAAPDEAQLAATRARMEEQVARVDPEVVRIHRAYDDHHRRQREAERVRSER